MSQDQHVFQDINKQINKANQKIIKKGSPQSENISEQKIQFQEVSKREEGEINSKPEIVWRADSLPKSNYIFGLYNFKATPNGNAWIIGTDDTSTTYPNAIANSNHICPDEILVPGKVPYQNVHYPVEQIGNMAFYRCGDPFYGYPYGKTKTVFIPKEVKKIKTSSFNLLSAVTSFTIEEGSLLQSLGSYCLKYMGYDMKDSSKDPDSSFFPGSESANTRTLVLPSSLETISEDSISYCHYFTRIIYCGSNNLNQHEYNFDGIETRVYVTPEYKSRNGNQIFGKTASNGISSNVISLFCSGCIKVPENYHPLFQKCRNSISCTLVITLIPYHDQSSFRACS